MRLKNKSRLIYGLIMMTAVICPSLSSADNTLLTPTGAITERGCDFLVAMDNRAIEESVNLSGIDFMFNDEYINNAPHRKRKRSVTFGNLRGYAGLSDAYNTIGMVYQSFNREDLPAMHHLAKAAYFFLENVRGDAVSKYLREGFSDGEKLMAAYSLVIESLQKNERIPNFLYYQDYLIKCNNYWGVKTSI